MNKNNITNHKPFPYNIVLIGFMGSGKSTIAADLSSRFALKVVEMDQVIAEREQMSISDIFTTHGEAYFRNLETQLLIELQSQTGIIISCGGGVALRDENVKEMKKNGQVILLTASPEVILSRVERNDERPLLSGNKNLEFIQNMIAQRKDKYQAAADIVIDTGHKSVSEISDELIAKLPLNKHLIS